MDLQPQNDQKEITRLLKYWSEGDRESLDEVFPLVYERLMGSARALMRGEKKGHTLQTAALLNEAYLELARGPGAQFDDREQFFRYAGQVMRHILVRHARRRLTEKRGGNAKRTPLEEALRLSDGNSLDIEQLLALEDALERLEAINPRPARVVELRFFAGLDNEEIARVLELSRSTVKREWQTARLWLTRELRGRVSLGA